MSGHGLTRGKYLTPEQIDNALHEVVAKAKEEGKYIALAGGAAAQLYGSRLFTSDIDVIASDDICAMVSTGCLSFGGHRTMSTDGIAIDIIVRNDMYRDLYDEALAESVYDEEIGGNVVSAEHLVAMKMAARRTKDMEAIGQMLADGSVDVDDAVEIIREHLGEYAASVFKDIVVTIARKKDLGELDA
jgi:hypothetical protein